MRRTNVILWTIQGVLALAAAGLVIIMSGAVAANIALGRSPDATAPAALGVLAAIVIGGRMR